MQCRHLQGFANDITFAGMKISCQTLHMLTAQTFRNNGFMEMFVDNFSCFPSKDNFCLGIPSRYLSLCVNYNYSIRSALENGLYAFFIFFNLLRCLSPLSDVSSNFC